MQRCTISCCHWFCSLLSTGLGEPTYVKVVEIDNRPDVDSISIFAKDDAT